jgi:hypothetical protein
MDSGSIKEIADQLGVGVDYLMAHLAEFAPSWSRMCVARESVCCLTCAALIVVFALAGVIAFRTVEDVSDKAVYVATCLILTVLTIVLIGFLASSIAMHVAAPDAALVNDLLEAVR